MGTQMPKLDHFGGALPVENVQELASKNLKEVPPRYIRPEVEFDEVSRDESLQIPVIDMSKLVDNPLVQDDRKEELAKLHMACSDWGFFQVVNHGIQTEVIEKMKIDLQEFFKLSLAEKMTCAQPPNSIEGYGQAFVVSDKQKLDWGDMLFLMCQPVCRRNMSLWPTNPKAFRETLENYSVELQKFALCLFRLMARNLGVDPEKVASMFEGAQAIRMNYYPPCEQVNKVLGIAPHSDATGLTILLEVNEVSGLQIKKKGKWVPIKPIPGAFTINIGDIIEIMSNGKYKSIEHRGVVNPDKERLSIAAFHSSNMKTTIGPWADLVKENGANYKTRTVEEYVKLIMSSKLDGKALLDSMKYKR